LAGLNFSTSASYIPGMPSKRVPTPREMLKVRRKGDTVRLTATVTRVQDEENPHLRKVTVTIPGYPIPITLSEASLAGEE
jgi:hypothetical protein